MSRETRLLLVTIAVSVLLLVLLARFRFPQQPSGAGPSPVVAPLDRILARDVLGDVATAMRTLDPIVGRAIVTLRISTAHEWPTPGSQDAVSLVPALRLRDDVAIAMLPVEARVIGVAGAQGDPAPIIGTDVVRSLTALRVPKQAAPTISLSPPLDGSNAVVVAVVEGSAAGPAIRPTFTGRAGRIRDPRWRSPLAALDPATKAGAFVFTLDGQLAGLVIATDGDSALVPAAELIEAGEALISGRRLQAGDLGVEVQPLSDALSVATGAPAGVVVRDIDPAGPGKDVLRPGDVVVALDDLPVYSTRAFERHVVALRAGVPVTVSIVRLGTRLNVTITARDRPERAAQPLAALGARLVAVSRLGTRVAEVTRGSAADRGGLASGDLITRCAEVESPTPEQVEQAWATAGGGGALLLVVSRAGTSLVLAIRKP